VPYRFLNFEFFLMQVLILRSNVINITKFAINQFTAYYFIITIIIIIIIIIISFMQGIYTYIPETNCVPIIILLLSSSSSS